MHILSLVFAVGATIAALPCFCEAAGTHDEVAEAPASDCCAGYVGERAPERPEHDCPHCATGGCDSLAAADDGSIELVVPAVLTMSLLPPATVVVSGFEPVVEELAPRGPPPAKEPAPPAPVHLLHSVFRC